MTAQRAKLWVVLLVASTAVAAPTEQQASPAMAPPDLSAAEATLPLNTPNKGYRMQGLYGFGTKPFYLERDPVTGAFDFSGASAGNSEPAHKFSSKVPAHADYDYEEIAMDADPIDRKDTLGPVRPNDLIDYSQKHSKIPQVPLVSGSYSSTKLQGAGADAKSSSTTTTTPPPNYYFSTTSTTTEDVLDFWPPTKPSAEVPSDYYEYDEVPAEVSETQPQAPSPAPSTVLPTTLPPYEYEAEETETARPIPPKKKQDVKKPEFPAQPPTPEAEFQPPNKVVFREPELELMPPEEESQPSISEVRPPDLEMRPPLVDFRPQEVKPLDVEMRPPLPDKPFQSPRPTQGVMLPPRYEPQRPERPALESQGWQIAQTPQPQAPPPSPFPSNRVTFPESVAATPAPFHHSSVPYRHVLPQGYEPKRPFPPPFRVQQQRPHFKRPHPHDSPYAFVESKPIDRIHMESRPPPPRYRPHQKVGGVRNRNDDSLPNILPQFRPNLRPEHGEHFGMRGPAPGSSNPPYFKRFPNSVQTPQFHHQQQQGPPGPPMGRRVGPDVATLQMMKGNIVKNPHRAESLVPQPPPVDVVVDKKQAQAQPPADERPVNPGGVYVVYANSNNNDIHVGQQAGASRPLPPSQLSEQPILPGKSDFPYAIEKNNNNDDRGHFSIKSKNKVSVPQGGDRSEITVSAVMHAGPDGHSSASSSQGQVFVVNTHQRPEVKTVDVVPTHHRPAEVVAPSNSESFQAPFHASANVAPSPGNGWTAIRETEFRPQGIVERADHEMPEPDASEPGTKFDIENFSPQLIGGFQPILPSADSSPKEAEEKKVQLNPTDRQER
ncbi:bromodomain-containing protein 4-like [Cloeon dipterum]|uniref:bromodomain-containing protein 4-like n=1 Tax=Cloeon dipterum TaxID=197152 RepID=UPI003220196C